MAKTTRDAVKILDRLTGNNTELRQMIAEEKINAQVALLAYQARTTARMNQEQLAELVGVEPSVIVRIEEADYEGASLSMLQRIADALHQRIAIGLVPAGEHQEVV